MSPTAAHGAAAPCAATKTAQRLQQLQPPGKDVHAKPQRPQFDRVVSGLSEERELVETFVKSGYRLREDDGDVKLTPLRPGLVESAQPDSCR